MAHGGTPEWNNAVLETVRPLQAKYPIEVAFGMADAMTLQEATKKLEAKNIRQIGVVRLFVSGESFTQETEQIFGLRAGAPASASAGVPHPTMVAAAAAQKQGGEHGGGHGAGQNAHGSHDAGQGAHGGHGAPGGHGAHGGHGGHSMGFFRVATGASFALSPEGLADAPGMGNVLADRAQALSKNPAQEDVLILAHGPGDDAENARWLAKLEARAAAIRSRAPFRRVQIETLREDWPDKRAEAEKRIRAFVEQSTAEGGTSIVIPFRVQGFGPYKQVLEGLTYVSDGVGLIPHNEVTRWIEQQILALRAGPFRTPSGS